MQYKISVVMPTYNTEKFLEHSINSIVNQTFGFENIEMIIVDDGSKDNTKQILEDYSKKYENIKCIFLDQNSGPAYARNIGLKYVTSDHIMFLDSDDRYVLNMCEVLYEVLQKTESDLVMSNVKYLRDNQFLENDICPFRETSYEIIDPKENENIFKRNFMVDKIYKIDFLKEFNIKCPEGLFYEDVFFTIQCYLNSDKLVFLEDFYGYEYHVRDKSENSSTSNTITEDFFRKCIKPYYLIYDYFYENGRPDLFNWFFKNWFIILIGHFSRLDVDYKKKISFLEELYNITTYSGFNGHMNEFWADFIFQNIKKRNFKTIIIFSKIINFLFNFYPLRKIYRWLYDKEYK